MPSPLKPISPERSARRAARLDSFEDGGEALADADAEGGDPVLAAAAAQLAAEGAGEAGAGAAERVAEGDRAAVDVEPLFVDPELTGAGEDLGGERLVDLDQVDVVEREAGVGERVGYRLQRPDAHDRRVDAGDAGGDDAGQRLGAEFLGALF